MKKYLLIALALLAASSPCMARGGYFNYVQQGGNAVSVAGFQSLTKVQRTFPSATVSVYLAGTSTLDTLYSDSSGTAKANPFTAGSDGSFTFYSDTLTVDITFSGTGITTGCGGAGQLACISAFTWSNVALTQSSSTAISAKSTGAVGNGKAAADGNAQAANTSFSSATAAFVSADTGKTIVIYGAGNAAHTANFTTTITFVNSTTVTLAAGPTATMNPATFVYGTLDTVKLQSAITAAAATVVQFHPSDGPYVVTESSLNFPAGIYLINNALTAASVLNITSDGGAIIVQTDSTKDIIQFTGFRQSVSGLTLTGGKRAISFLNPNTDSSTLTVTGCTFQANTLGLYVTASTSSTGTSLPYSTGTVTTTIGSNSVTGVGTAWVDANHAYKELHLTASDEYYRIVEVTAANTLITSRPIKVTGAGLAYEIGDYHTSVQVTVNQSNFINVAQVAFLNTEQATFNDDWVELWGYTTSTNPYPRFQPHTAAFRTMYGHLIVNRMVGVPVMCDSTNCAATLIRNPRWFDSDGGNITASQNRFGGEGAGMMIVKSFCPYHDSNPFTGCNFVFKDNWQLYAGLIAGNASDVGVMGLYANGRAATGRENVPGMFVVRNNAGWGGTPIVNNEAMVDGAPNDFENSSSLDTATFFATGVAVSTEKKFRYDVGVNDTDTGAIWFDGTWNGATRAGGFNRFSGSISSLLTNSLVLSNNLAAGTCDTVRTFSVSGVKDGDVVEVGLTNALAGSFALTYRAWASADNVVSIQLCNPTTAAFVGGATVNVTFTIPKWKQSHD